MKLTNKHLIVIFVFFLAVILCLLAYIRNQNINVKIDKKKTEIQTTKGKIDLSVIAIDNELNHLSEQSEKTAKQSNVLTKKVKYEKPIIGDASYDSMCDYITKYKP